VLAHHLPSRVMRCSCTYACARLPWRRATVCAELFYQCILVCAPLHTLCDTYVTLSYIHTSSKTYMLLADTSNQAGLHSTHILPHVGTAA
jgi:hypothetical protein